MDLTGGLVDFPLAPHLKNKVLHTQAAVSPKCALADGDLARDERAPRATSPVALCERISNKNTAEDICDMLEQFLSAVSETREEGAKSPPLFLTDCAPQPQPAVLWTFLSPNRTSKMTRVEHRNVPPPPPPPTLLALGPRPKVARQPSRWPTPRPASLWNCVSFVLWGCSSRSAGLMCAEPHLGG